MNRFEFTKNFQKSLEKIVKKDPNIKNRIDKTLRILLVNPYYPSLNTHVINQNEFQYDKVLSSRVTGDVRILWAFDHDENLVIILLKIGGHDQVY